MLYIGVTNDLQRRVYEHRNKLIKGFTSRYNVDKLVHYESTTDINSAIEREKQLKSWSRAKKEELINKNNPQREDLSVGWFG
ncbi:MAG: GIY-YIG nuclease family protein [Christensenellales bacterium]